MKLTPYIAAVFILISCRPTSISRNNECSGLRNGKFFYRSELSPNSFTIDRKDSLQVETDNATGEDSRWRITWTGDCTYEMTNFDDHTRSLITGDSIKHLPPIKFIVLKHTAQYYIFEARKSGSERVITDTLFSVK